jgi:hypothetical protein
MRALAWLWGEQAPFLRPEGLTEYPLYSPLDCDLLGFPEPDASSGNAGTDYAAVVLTRAFDRSGSYFNLNCHDWIIGTGDRLRVLEQALAHISRQAGVEYWTPGLVEVDK